MTVTFAGPTQVELSGPQILKVTVPPGANEALPSAAVALIGWPVRPVAAAVTSSVGEAEHGARYWWILMGEHELLAAWDRFLEAYERGDDDACLQAIRAWIEVWDRQFWARDFTDFDTIYDAHVEARNRTALWFVLKEFEGVNGFRTMRDEAADVAARFWFEIESFRRASDERVVALGHIRARGRYSGILLRHSMAVIWTLRDGRILRAEAYTSLHKALRDADLST